MKKLLVSILAVSALALSPMVASAEPHKPNTSKQAQKQAPKKTQKQNKKQTPKKAQQNRHAQKQAPKIQYNIHQPRQHQR